MEDHRHPRLNPDERGAGLLLVLTALATLLPLVLALSELTLVRQRQGVAFRENVGGRIAARGGLEEATARLTSGRLVLEPRQEESFDIEPPNARPVHVRVTREADVVVTAEGRVLTPEEVPKDETSAVAEGGSGHGLVISQYKQLEVYLVEVESPAPAALGATRLLAVLTRFDARGLVCIGLRYDRGIRG